MAELTWDFARTAGSKRSTELFEQHQQEIFRRTDRLFVGLLFCEWLFAIFLAFVVSPRAWAGSLSTVHPHVWAAIVLGGSITSLPVYLALRYPGRAITRHVIATAQMLVSALLIHLTGGRIETHFHVFGSLAFLAFYRDWRVFIPATVVVALDHFLRGLYWPQSVYGVLTAGGWRWLEHAGWVLFEDVFLVYSCFQSVAEMRAIAERRAQLEATNEIVERAVTERTRELAESEDRFKGFMDHSPSVTWIKDESGRYVYVNETFERIFDVSSKAVVGTTDRERWDPEIAEAIVRNDRKALAGEGGGETLETIPTPDGTSRQWTVYRFAMTDASGNRLLGGIALDMTEKLLLAEHLRQSQRMEAVGQLSGGIAHDFNNLLTAVNGYAQLLLREARENDVLRRYVAEILRAGERAAGLTRQLLAYSRKQVLQPEVLRLNGIVGEAEGLLRRLIGEGIRLSVRLDSELLSVRADPGQITQVLVNLILNARDAMPDGGDLTVETSNVDLAAGALGVEGPARPGPYVLLSVGDTGHGMDAETKARAFEPFFTTKGIGKGPGLGLSTVHGIVHQSGGHVTVESAVGLGTTFRIYLPALAPEVERDASAEEEVLAAGGSETILLVENEEGVRNLVRDLLKTHGYEVVEARTGEEAAGLSDRQLRQVDMLMTDLAPPGANHRALMERMRRVRPGLRVLFMTGYAEDASARQAALKPGSDVIEKPFTTDQVLARVRQALDRRAAA
jgi:PAS domain S-box-containing protein